MSRRDIPPHEIISYPIKPPVGENHFGAKPIVASSYPVRPDDPWNKEFWGRTAQDATARAQKAIDDWVGGTT